MSDLKLTPSFNSTGQLKRGRLFILSAPSGAGKTTLGRALRAHFSDLGYSVSYTTRTSRSGEIEGKDYHYISEDQFKEMIALNRWVEWAKVHDHYYGTPAAYVEKQLAQGKDVLLDIDVQGAAQILKRYPDSIAIFILPPSVDELRSRLEKRGTDAPTSIAKRINAAKQEMDQQKLYRHVIVNERLEDAIAKLIEIVTKYRAMA